MATVEPKDLFSLWKRENIPVEQAVGYDLQNMIAQQQAHEAYKQKTTAEIKQLREAILRLRADVDSLIAHTHMPPNPKSKQ